MDGIIDDLLAAKDLKVILYPDTRRENQPDVEYYDLSHVVIDGDRFWGAFRSVHSSRGLAMGAEAQSEEIPQVHEGVPSGYAYSNYYRFCINYSYLQNVSRVYEDVAYSKLRFIAAGLFEEVWRRGDALDMSRLYDKVEQGKRFKVIMRDENGFTSIHPVHTPEVYVEKNMFIFDTEADALPNAIFSRQAM
ncbi:MAG: hypothetical protein OQJ76_01315, partial [Rhodospirillales bacterium]|nr:hypothetical protein [Rhodospirillales bacterium]